MYLNLEGREAKGIVKPEEAEELKAGHRPQTHRSCRHGPRYGCRPPRTHPPVRLLGPFVDEAPDLLVDFARGYRASWGTSLGGAPEGQFEDNTKKWSGDHIIDPELVPGVLFMNRPYRQAARA